MRWFEQENIEIKQDESILGTKLDEEAINNKYQQGDVRIVTEMGRFQLTTVTALVESEDYILNPEFQRRHRWSNAKKSKLIESFIMNVPVPPIFLYEIDFSVYEVMDGLQRLTALYEFFTDKFVLEGLEEWPELNGLLYSELPKQVKKGIDRRHLSSMILLKETAKSQIEAERLKQLVFERINSGGEQLEDQETRNAIHNGPLNKLCINLARNEHFCTMWGIPKKTEEEANGGQLPQELVENPLFRKMQDVEIVLRFFAFRHLDKWERFSLRVFLNKFLHSGNMLDESVLKNYEYLFLETSKLAYDLLDEQAFCLFRIREDKWKLYNRPTKVVYDPIMYVLSGMLEFKEDLITQKDSIKAKIEDFYKENYSSFSGRNTGKNDVSNRIELMKQFFQQFIKEKEQ